MPESGRGKNRKNDWDGSEAESPCGRGKFIDMNLGQLVIKTVFLVHVMIHQAMNEFDFQVIELKSHFQFSFLKAQIC